MSKVNIILLTKHLGIIMKYYVNTTVCEFQHYGLSQSTLVLPSNNVPSMYHGDTLVPFIWVTKTSYASTMNLGHLMVLYFWTWYHVNTVFLERLYDKIMVFV